MAGNTRKLHYKHIKDTAAEHVGHQGDIWYDPNTTDLRFYNGDPGGALLGGNNTLIDYGQADTGSGNQTINLAYSIHWMVTLSDGRIYQLDDGTEFQTITFAPAAGATFVQVHVDNAKYYNDGASTWVSGSGTVLLFPANVGTFAQSTNTAQFLNGSWHFGPNVGWMPD